MKLTLTIFGRVSRLTLWENVAAPVPAPVATASITPAQRAELFEEWEKERARAGGGSHLQPSGQHLTALEHPVQRWEAKRVGFAPNEKETTS